MQNWQRKVNYRRYENADGTFIYTITVDGVSVEVSEAVYKAYAQVDRKERYCAERDAGRLLSLERMAEDEVLLSFLADTHSESAEDTAIEKMLIRKAMTALSSLSVAEQHLIKSVVMDGVTEKEYADAIGVYQSTVNKRKKRILKKIFVLMELNH